MTTPALALGLCGVADRDSPVPLTGWNHATACSGGRGGEGRLQNPALPTQSWCGCQRIGAVKSLRGLLNVESDRPAGFRPTFHGVSRIAAQHPHHMVGEARSAPCGEQRLRRGRKAGTSSGQRLRNAGLGWLSPLAPPAAGYGCITAHSHSTHFRVRLPAPTTPTTEYVSPARDLGDQRIGWRRNRRLAPGQATMPMPPRR